MQEKFIVESAVLQTPETPRFSKEFSKEFETITALINEGWKIKSFQTCMFNGMDENSEYAYPHVVISAILTME